MQRCCPCTHPNRSSSMNMSRLLASNSGPGIRLDLHNQGPKMLGKPQSISRRTVRNSKAITSCQLRSAKLRLENSCASSLYRRRAHVPQLTCKFVNATLFLLIYFVLYFLSFNTSFEQGMAQHSTASAWSLMPCHDDCKDVEHKNNLARDNGRNNIRVCL